VTGKIGLDLGPILPWLLRARACDGLRGAGPLAKQA